MEKYVIILTNKNSGINERIVKFLQLNLININKCGIMLVFKIAKIEDIKIYDKKNIKTFPTLVTKTGNISGLSNIINFLSNLQNKPSKTINADDCINDFWKQTLGNVQVDESGTIKDDNDDEGEETNNIMQKKMQSTINERGISKSIMPKKGSSNKHTNQSENNISNIGEQPKMQINNSDDELMKKFYENQGEDI